MTYDKIFNGIILIGFALVIFCQVKWNKAQMKLNKIFTAQIKKLNKKVK